MSALLRKPWPRAAAAGLRSDVAARAMGAIEARRLSTIMLDAEAQARAAIAGAEAEVRMIFAAAKAEAEALLALLPDFAAIEAAPSQSGKSALRAIRDAADRHGIALAAIVGRSQSPTTRLARLEAVLGVLDACPGMSADQVGALFKRSGKHVERLKREALEARERGEI